MSIRSIFRIVWWINGIVLCVLVASTVTLVPIFLSAHLSVEQRLALYQSWIHAMVLISGSMVLLYTAAGLGSLGIWIYRRANVRRVHDPS
jgi:Ni,Fe-hydrogenase I cytochrome b subunit